MWWDDTVCAQIARAGATRIAAFQVCDWVTPLPAGVLLGRALPGDGCIELRRLREAVDAAGYAGPIEVEVFSPRCGRGRARRRSTRRSPAICATLLRATSANGGGRRRSAPGWASAPPRHAVLGAAMAARHGGAVPVAGLLVGGALMAALLWGQGRIGLRRPLGDGGTLTAVLPAYLGDTSRLLLAAVLAVSMVGWNGFNVGLGGASLAALTHLPGWAGPVLLEVAVLAVSWAPARLGNRVAVVTTPQRGGAGRLVPDGASTARRAGPPRRRRARRRRRADRVRGRVRAARTGLQRWPFPKAGPGLVRGAADRAGAARVLAGAGLWLRTGSADVVALLAAGSGLAAYANLFVAVAVFAAALTTTYSGSLALRGLAPRLPARAAMLLVAVLGGCWRWRGSTVWCCPG